MIPRRPQGHDMSGSFFNAVVLAGHPGLVRVMLSKHRAVQAVQSKPGLRCLQSGPSLVEGVCKVFGRVTAEVIGY